MKKHDYRRLVSLVRHKCGPVAWRQGHKLVSMDAVNGVSADDDEVVLVVYSPGTLTPPQVVLYPDDDEWECDCTLDTDNCAHTAAAVIALATAVENGQPLPKRTAPICVLEYRFYTHRGGLTLIRRFVDNHTDPERLRRPLLTQVATREFPRGFSPSRMDLNADKIIGRQIHPDRPLPASSLNALIPVLRECSTMFLDDTPCSSSDDIIRPVMAVHPHTKGGAALKLLPNPDADAFPAPGIAMCAGTLHRVGQQSLCGPSMELLPRTIHYKTQDMAEFVVNVLPQLERDSFVEIKISLPAVSRFLNPGLIMNMSQQNNSVTVFPELVYGVPPHVKIRNDRMIYLDGTIPRRNKEQERKLRGQLRDDLNLVVDQRVTFTGKDAWEFSERLRHWSEAKLDHSQHLLSTQQPLTPSIHIEDDVFQIEFQLAVDNASDNTRRASVSNVLEAWQEGLDITPLEGGGFASIPREWLDTHGPLLLDILDARDTRNAVSPGAVPALARFCDELHIPRPASFKQLEPLIEGFTRIPEVPLPDDFNGQLRSYQTDGVNWLMFLKNTRLGAVLADDMGLGKTIQALCVCEKNTLVVCPTSVLHNWQTEANRFRPALSVNIYHGANRSLEQPADIVITNYALLRIDRSILSKTKWECVILDEAQNIKNPSSQTAKAAFALDAPFKIALSGTPIENRMEELWSIFNFTSPGLLGSYSNFQKRYAIPVAEGSLLDIEKLKQRIKPFILRRNKEEVAPELPPRTDIVLECELTEEERAVYDVIHNATRHEVLNAIKAGGSVMAVLEQLLRLRQAACHTGLLPGKTAATSSKVDLLLHQLQSSLENDHKALVFSQWTGFLDLIEPHLRQCDISYCRLDGNTRNRKAVVDQFQTTASIKVMLISLKAGGTGLNLTAADHVFIMDPWWNPAVEDQAADRTHRIGQNNPVLVYRIAAAHTVEGSIIRLQQRKRELAASTIDGQSHGASITREDLMELLM